MVSKWLLNKLLEAFVKSRRCFRPPSDNGEGNVLSEEGEGDGKELSMEEVGLTFLESKFVRPHRDVLHQITLDLLGGLEQSRRRAEWKVFEESLEECKIDGAVAKGHEVGGAQRVLFQDAPGGGFLFFAGRGQAFLHWLCGRERGNHHECKDRSQKLSQGFLHHGHLQQLAIGFDTENRECCELLVVQYWHRRYSRSFSLQAGVGNVCATVTGMKQSLKMLKLLPMAKLFRLFRINQLFLHTK